MRAIAVYQIHRGASIARKLGSYRKAAPLAAYQFAGLLTLTVSNQLFTEHRANTLVLQSPLARAVRNLSISACIM